MIKQLAVPNSLNHIIYKVYIVKICEEKSSVYRFVSTGFPCIVIHMHDSECEMESPIGSHRFTLMPQAYLCGIFTNPIAVRCSNLQTLTIVLHPWIMGSLFPSQMIRKDSVTDLDKDETHSKIHSLLLGTFWGTKSEFRNTFDSLFNKMMEEGSATQHLMGHYVNDVQRYVEFIHSHPNCRLRDFDSERNLQLGYKTLTRRFAECTGVTLGQFMKVKREIYATKLLLQSQEKKIEDLAFLCGYESMGHFHRFCRRTFGKSPRNAADGMDISIKEEVILHRL